MPLNVTSHESQCDSVWKDPVGEQMGHEGKASREFKETRSALGFLQRCRKCILGLTPCFLTPVLGYAETLDKVLRLCFIVLKTKIGTSASLQAIVSSGKLIQLIQVDPVCPGTGRQGLGRKA